MSEHCPSCGSPLLASPEASLTAPERDLLRAARMRKDEAPFMVADLARWSGWSYGRAWRATNRLFLRGYIKRDPRRRVLPLWDRLPIAVRADALLDSETPDGAVLQFGEPGVWAKRLERFLAHFGGRIVEP